MKAVNLIIENHHIKIDSYESTYEFVSALHNKRKGLVSNLNMHAFHLLINNKEFREAISRSEICHSDGWPVAAALKLVTRAPSVRLGYRDWISDYLPLLHGKRIALIGGTGQENLAALKFLREHYQGVHFDGRDGYGRAETIVSFIDDVDPDVVVLGMGMPLQELFATKYGLHERRLCFCAGGWIKQVAGFEALAPSAVVQLKLEWLWRLASSPRQFWRRYLVEPLPTILYFSAMLARGHIVFR